MPGKAVTKVNELLICPVCGESFYAGAKHCEKCGTTVMDWDDEGHLFLLDPKVLDRSRTYKVKGMKNPQTGERDTEFYPGDLVVLPEPDVRMLDMTVRVHVDGGRRRLRFLMPEHDVVLTTTSSGMAMNSVRYYGPYGEPLRSPVYSEENLLKEGEPTPQPVPMISMPMMGMMGMTQMQPVKAAVAEEDQVICGACGQKVRKARFCANCGCALKVME